MMSTRDEDGTNFVENGQSTPAVVAQETVEMIVDEAQERTGLTGVVIAGEAETEAHLGESTAENMEDLATDIPRTVMICLLRLKG